MAAISSSAGRKENEGEVEGIKYQQQQPYAQHQRTHGQNQQRQRIGLWIVRARNKASGALRVLRVCRQSSRSTIPGRQQRREQIKRRPTVSFDEPAGNRPDVHATNCRERGQQSKLGGGNDLLHRVINRATNAAVPIPPHRFSKRPPSPWSKDVYR